MKTNQEKIALLLCNLLEHFDTALYTFLTPWIAPLLFPKDEAFCALIYTYGLIPLGYLSKPFGAIFFASWSEDRKESSALGLAMIGMSFCSFLIALTPFHAPSLAMFYLTALRVLQSFFASGFSAAAPIYLLESTSIKHRELFSSLFGFTTMLGIIFASLAVSFFIKTSSLLLVWQRLYFLGAFFTFLSYKFLQKEKIHWAIFSFFPNRKNFFQKIGISKKIFWKTFFVAGLDSACYYCCFLLFPAAISIFSKTGQDLISKTNFYLLIIDALLLPCFGALAQKWGGEKVMRFASCGIFLFSPLLFFLLSKASLFKMVCIRIIAVALSLFFSAPFHAYTYKLAADSSKYTAICFARSLGSQFLGSFIVATSLWLYKKTQYPASIGIVWSLLGCLCFLILTNGVANFSLIRHRIKQKFL